MLKLKLEVVIRTFENGIQSSSIPDIRTGVRIFDEKSLRAAEFLIRAGGLGRFSKSRFIVTGWYLDSDGEWDCTEFHLFRTVPGRHRYNAVAVPDYIRSIL